MDNLGDFFKGLRMSKNLSIDDLAGKTKIRPNIIKDIETNNLKDLYESGHLKIFIQTLGKFYDASPSDISLVMKEIDKKFNIVDHSNIQVIEHKSESKFVISSNTIYFFFLVLFLIGIAIVVFYFYNEGKLTYEKVKQDLFSEKAKTEKVNNKETEPEKDSIWVKQQEVLNAKPEANQKRKSVIDNVKVIYDTTDYVSDIIFDNVISALNPRL